MNDVSSSDISPLATLFALLFLAFLACSLWTWVWFLKNLRSIPQWSVWHRAQNSATIGFIDLVGCFGCMVVSQILAFSIGTAIWGGISPSVDDPTNASIANPIALRLNNDEVNNEEEPVSSDRGGEHGQANEAQRPMPPWVTPILTVSMLLGAVLSLGVVKFRTQAAWPKLGFPLKDWGIDGLLGWNAFLLFTPIVLVVSQVVVQSTNVEYEHPVLDTLRESPWTLPFLFLGAAVCAPIWEELVFRGFLIGWFDTLRLSRGSLKTILLGEKPALESSMPEEPIALDSPYRLPDVADHVSQASAMPMDVRAENVDARTVTDDPTAQPWWPAILSGAIFGLAHFEYGVSWVPLVVFGILLGRLFQWRRSVVPCIIVHALFNGLSLLGLSVQVLTKAP